MQLWGRGERCDACQTASRFGDHLYRLPKTRACTDENQGRQMYLQDVADLLALPA